MMLGWMRPSTACRHEESEPLRLLCPRRIVARMVIGKDDDLIACLEIEAARHHVVRLARVSSEHDLFWRHAQKSCDDPSRFFLPGAHLLPVVERRVSIHVFRAAIHRFEDWRRRRAQVRRVQDGELRGHQELLPDRHPESFVGSFRRLLQRRRPGEQRLGQKHRAAQRQESREVAPAHTGLISGHQNSSSQNGSSGQATKTTAAL
jgi:hypothetical protein